MEKWADRLNYIGDIANKKMVVYRAIYHGQKKDLYYVGQTSSKLVVRWQVHHDHWSNACNILSYIDILAAITEPEDWEIEVIGVAKTKNELSKIENDYIYNLFKDYDLNKVLNLKIPKIPSKYAKDIKKKQDRWFVQLGWYYSSLEFEMALKLNNQLDFSIVDGSAIGNYMLPPYSNVFYLFNNYYSINLLFNRLNEIRKEPRDLAKLVTTNLDMRFLLFKFRFLSQVKNDNALQLMEAVKKAQRKNLISNIEEI